jgi:hypothetical protein
VNFSSDVCGAVHHHKTGFRHMDGHVRPILLLDEKRNSQCNSPYDIYLINQFPDFNAPGFDLERYYSLFLEKNVIINAVSSDVEYGDHWSPLSIKCAFRGKNSITNVIVP